MTLTDAQIRELLEMEAGASPDPWSQANRWVRCSSHLVASVEGPWGIWDTDQSLIIAARNHLRALCEEVLRLRAASDHTRALCQEVLRLRVANDDLEQRNADLHEIAGQRFDFAEEQREAAKDGVLRESDNGDGDPA